MSEHRLNYYARNLMELFAQEGMLDICYQDIDAINDALNCDQELLRSFTSADLTLAEKKQLLQEKVDDDLDESVLAGLFLTIESLPRKHMEAELVHEFLAFYYQTKGVVFGTAFSARKLSRINLRKLEAAFTSRLGKKIRLENKVDDSLIGGVKVVIGENVWDGSYKAKVEELKDSLLNKELDRDAEGLGLDLLKEVTVLI